MPFQVETIAEQDGQPVQITMEIDEADLLRGIAEHIEAERTEADKRQTSTNLMEAEIESVLREWHRIRPAVKSQMPFLDERLEELQIAKNARDET